MTPRTSALVMTLTLLTAAPLSHAQPKEPAEAAGGEKVAHFKEYQPEDNSFRLLYPSQWKVIPGGRGATVVTAVDADAIKNKQTPQSMTLALAANKGASLQKVADAMRNQMAGKEGVQLVEDKGYTVGPWKAHRFVFDSTANGRTLRAIQFVMVKDPSAYVLTFYMPPEQYNKETQDRAFQLCGLFRAGPDAVAAEGGTPYENKEFGFSLVYPAGWNDAGLNQKGVAISLFKRATAGKVPQLIMIMADRLEADEKTDLKEMESKLVETSKSSLKDGKVIEAADTKLGGEPARRVILGGTRTADNHEGNVILLFCIQGKATYALMAGGPVEDFAGIKADAEKIAESFKFGAGGAAVAGTGDKPAPAVTVKPEAATSGFDSPALGLKVSYPAGWSARKSPDASVPFLLLPTATRGGKVSIIALSTQAVTPDARLSTKEQADAVLAGARGTMSDAKVIEAADTKVGAVRARRVVIGGQGKTDKADMRLVFLVFQHGGTAFTLTGQSTADQFDQLKEAFDGVVSSIQLATPAPKNGK